MSTTNTVKDDTVKNELFRYVKDPKTSFYWYHNPNRINYFLNSKVPKWKMKTGIELTTIDDNGNEKNVIIHEALNDFFNAILDEKRLKKANRFSKFALEISDNDILSYFRVAASKREFGADIDFDRQRDHAVHTLYNYILGWYLFDYSKDINEAFANSFKKKKELYPNVCNSYIVDTGEKYGEINECQKLLANEFGDVWSITSLLHDIGYILEGTISSASIEVENVRVSRGSKIIHDYFNHQFWKDCIIDFRAVQSIAKFLDVSFPDFRSSKSLASLSDHLCDVGTCENIRNNLDIVNKFPSTYETIKKPYGLNREAFSLWMTYYEVYRKAINDDNSENISTMEVILEIVKEQYYDAMLQGTFQGYRNLNHGVCSGLIVLKALSFFYDFVYGFKDVNKSYENYEKFIKEGSFNKVDKISSQSYEVTKSFITSVHLPEQIKIRYGDDGRKADFWFDKVLWATASVAIHDIIQEDYYERICEKRGYRESLKIKLSEEPLAYLGVLVDALQEWDRYTVSGESAFSSKVELLQSNEVHIRKCKDGKIKFSYPKKNENERDKIKKILNRCLDKDDLNKVIGDL